MKLRDFILLLGAILIIMFQTSCDSTTDPPAEDKDTSRVRVYKPNIYIYPEETIDLSVNITFPLGGEITESIPKYNTGWRVSVEPTGKIDKEYNYLFYECDVPNLFQKTEGWLLEQKELDEFFKTNLSKHGFSKNEIKDFVDYWTPLLTKFHYYEIYPQYSSTIGKTIRLNFSKQPKNSFRLFYYIKGRKNTNITLSAPLIEIGKRKNYYIMEWGVVLQ